MSKVRKIIIDGVEIMTSLSAVEIASLPEKYHELELENKKLQETITNIKKKAVKELKKEISKSSKLEQEKENLIKYLEDEYERIDNLYLKALDDRDNDDRMNCLGFRQAIKEILERIKIGKYD